jgi:hypothetical protein
MGEFMGLYNAEIAFITSMIEKLTGINPVTMGVTPSDGTTATATNVAASGTNNVIRPILTGIFEIKADLAEHVSRRAPLLMRNVPECAESYSRVIGSQGVDVLIKAEHLGAEYGMYMTPRPSAEAKQRLVTLIEQAIQRGRDGEASINLGQAFYILQRIEKGGNLSRLQNEVDLFIRKSEEQRFAQKRQLIQEQSQQQSAQQQVAAQSEQQGLLIKTQIDAKTKEDEFQRQRMIMAEQMQLNVKEYGYKKYIDEMGGDTDETE